MSQPLYEITRHPVDLSEFGVNPYGSSIYRVVWGDTRTVKVLHQGKFKTLPRYVHGDEAAAKGNWVLEKWASSDVVLGMTREQYAQFLTTFPNSAAEEYPERGEHELKYVFAKGVDEAGLKLSLRQHEFELRTMTNDDRKQAVVAEEELKDKAKDVAFDELYMQAKEESLTHAT